MKWNIYSIGLLCFVLGAGLKSCVLEHECKTEGKVQFNSSKNYDCKESK